MKGKAYLWCRVKGDYRRAQLSDGGVAPPIR